MFKKYPSWWKDTGKPEDLLEANQLILDDIDTKVEAQVDSSCRLMGKISIKENTVIKPNTRIKGPVIIGPIVRLVQMFT